VTKEKSEEDDKVSTPGGRQEGFGSDIATGIECDELSEARVTYFSGTPVGR